MDKKTSARLAEADYVMVEPLSKEERYEKINEMLNDTGFVIEPQLSNNEVIYYVNNTKKEIHISHRGTDASGRKTKSDITSDVLFGMGKEDVDKQFLARSNRTKLLVGYVPDDYKLSMSGHSLGGGTIVKSLKDSKNVRERVDKVHTFNSAFSPFAKQGVGSVTKKMLDKKVTHHRIENDAVSASSFVNTPFGNVKTYKPNPNLEPTGIIPKTLKGMFKSVEALHAHSIAHFY